MLFTKDEQNKAKGQLLAQMGLANNTPENIAAMSFYDLLAAIEKTTETKNPREGIKDAQHFLTNFLGQHEGDPTLGGQTQWAHRNTRTGVTKRRGYQYQLEVQEPVISAVISHYAQLCTAEALQEHINHTPAYEEHAAIALERGATRSGLNPVYAGILAVINPDALDNRQDITPLLEGIRDELNSMGISDIFAQMKAAKSHICGTPLRGTWKSLPASGDESQQRSMLADIQTLRAGPGTHGISTGNDIRRGIVLGMMLQAREEERPLTDIIDKAAALGKITIQKKTAVTPNDPASRITEMPHDGTPGNL